MSVIPRPAAPDRRRPPSGFRCVRSPRAAWLARPECVEEIRAGRADLLLLGRGRRDPRPGGGRGPLARLELAGAPALGKRALHGGLLGRLFGGIYLGRRRALAQIDAAERLDRAGVPTPELLAIGWRPALGPFGAVAIVTRAIPGAQNLYEAARDDAPWRRRRVILETSGALVRRMHDAGFRHADLNVTNLVLGRGPDGDRVHVVDLDRGRFLGRLGPSERFRGLARLLRSYEKWMAGRFRLSPREELLFLRAYCKGDRDMASYLGRRLRRYRARLGPRRLAWLLLGARGATGR
jgi:hypothetical protein